MRERERELSLYTAEQLAASREYGRSAAHMQREIMRGRRTHLRDRKSNCNCGSMRVPIGRTAVDFRRLFAFAYALLCIIADFDVGANHRDDSTRLWMRASTFVKKSSRVKEGFRVQVRIQMCTEPHGSRSR